MADDFGEERQQYRQRIATLAGELEQIRVALTDVGLDRISLKVAKAVEDQFAMHHPGGRTQRLAKIQMMVRDAVRLATYGEARWDAWTPQSFGPAPMEPRGEQSPAGEWQPIETAPKDGGFIWLSDGFFMRVCYWYIVTNDPSKEHWADMLRAECGEAGDLQFTPTHWQPLPVPPQVRVGRHTISGSDAAEDDDL